MKNFSLTLTLTCLLLTATSGISEMFVVSVRGKRQSGQTVKGIPKIVSETVTNTTLCASLGVDPKKYSIVWDVLGGALLAIPNSTSAMLPTKEIFAAQTQYSSYSSVSPVSDETTNEIQTAAGGMGTDLDTLHGIFTILLKEKFNGVFKTPTGVMGTVSATATGTALKHYYSLTFSGTKVFVASM